MEALRKDGKAYHASQANIIQCRNRLKLKEVFFFQL